jgi:hypothetical protein
MDATACRLSGGAGLTTVLTDRIMTIRLYGSTSPQESRLSYTVAHTRSAILLLTMKQNDEKMRIRAQNAKDARLEILRKAEPAANAIFAANAKAVAHATQSGALLVIRTNANIAKIGGSTIDVRSALEPCDSGRVKAGYGVASTPRQLQQQVYGTLRLACIHCSLYSPPKA